ncbi:MAG: TonB family protein [Chitinivibrionales bacterium]|nr:TonB family protein [Chitinivibrionales bacterium]
MRKSFISVLHIAAMVVIGNIYGQQTLRAAEADTDTAIVLYDDTLQPQSDESLPLVADSMQADGSAADSVPQMPKLITFVNADYPQELQRKGIEGSVILDILVSDSGAVDSVAVVKPLHPVLDSTACVAARRFIFAPARLNDQPITVILQYEYRFSLSEAVSRIDSFINFSGRLVEKGTRTPLVNAMVVLSFADTTQDTTLPLPFSRYRQKLGSMPGQYLEEDRLVTLTDSIGQFRFHSLPCGDVVVSIPLPGYESFNEREHISAGEKVTVTYYLGRRQYSDYEVVAYGRQEQKEVSRQQLTLYEVKKLPGFGGDAIKVIQAMPGVARPSFMGSDVIVRGAPTDDSRFLIDGLEIPILYHLGGVKSIYNSDALSSVDFYPGGFGARYGGGVAGMVEIQGRSALTDRWHTKIDMSTIDGSLFVEGPVTEQISLLASVRRSFFGDILDYYFRKSKQDFLATVFPIYWDYLVRSDVTLGDKSHLFVTVHGGFDSMAVYMPALKSGSSEIDDSVDKLRMMYGFHLVYVGWDYKLSPHMKNTLRTGIVKGESRSSIFGQASWSEDVLGTGLRDEFSWGISPPVHLLIGLDITSIYDDVTLTIPNGGGMIVRDTMKGWHFGVYGVYGQVEFRPIENIVLIPGIRFDYYPELNYDGAIVPQFWKYHDFNNNRGISGEPAVRLTGRYTLTKGHTIKTALGTYSQTPKPRGQVIHRKWGDPMLAATKAAHYVLGYEWQISDLINADISAYHNRQWDIPRMTPPQEFNKQGTSKLWLGDQKGRMSGLEIMVRHNQGRRFFGWVAYSLSRSQRYDATARRWELYDKDQTHNLQLLGSWKLPKAYDVGIRLRYVTGDPTTPLIGVQESENNNVFIPKWGKKNSTRYSPFVQLDLRGDKKMVFRQWIYSWYVDLQNVSYFIYKSPEMTLWNDFYTDKMLITTPFVAGFGIKAEF